MTLSLAPLTVATHTIGRSARDDLIADVRVGLTATPKQLPPRWFYDERGSELFDAITQLPEYYQTRTEMSILRAQADDIAAAVHPEALVELGAGSCTKSRVLIDACRRTGRRPRRRSARDTRRWGRCWRSSQPARQWMS